MKNYTDEELDEMSYSDEYAHFVMDNSTGDRCITNGNALLIAMEDGYMFEEFLKSLEK